LIIKTKVSEVQIYRSGASVTRKGDAEFKAGKNILYIGGMTETSGKEDFNLLLPESMKVINFSIIGIDDIKSEELKESEKLQKQIEELDYQTNVCNMLIDLKKTNGNFTVRSEVSVEDQENYIQKLPDELLKLHRQITDIAAEKKKLEKKYQEAVAEENKPLVMAEIISESDGIFPLVLKYTEKSGRWMPKYEVRFKDNSTPLEVSMKAQIMQNSGEDWNKVKVTLYSGNPSQSHDLPILNPIHLSIRENEPQLKFGAVRASAMRAPMEDGICESAADNSMANTLTMSNGMASMEQAIVDDEETMSSYMLPDEKDILTDTDGNISVLQMFTVNADYHLLGIPKIDTRCFLTADISSADWPLPPAKASIYIKDIFAGEVYVNPDSNKERFSISLGMDERLTVIRNELPKKTQDALLKNQRKQTRSSTISLVNNSNDTVKVLLKDQIPISTDKAISVELLEASDGLLDSDKGELSWDISIEPGEKKEFNLSYSIAWPKDKHMNERIIPSFRV